MSLILEKMFSSIALSHFIVDVLNGERGILLAYLSVPLGLTNAVLGLISTLYSLVAALAQPFFGFLADRFGPRWIVSGGVLWMVGFFALALTVQGQVALVFLILASLGSGAFHPAGVAQVTLMGHTHLAGREATAASYFFVFGQFGYFIGPVLGGPLLDLFGPSGLLLLVVFGLPISGFAGWQLRSGAQPVARAESAPENPHSEFVRPLLGGILAIGLVAASQSWVQQNMITFIPKYLQDMGETASTYGLLAALFMGGSAIGTIIGGMAADRFGRRRMIVLSMAASIAPLVLMARVGVSGWLYLLIPLTGVLNGGVYTIIVVIAQRLIPGGRALASGLILGFLFSSGAVGTLFSGYLADRMGFIPVFYLSAAIALVGVLAAFGLQREPALSLAPTPVDIAGE